MRTDWAWLAREFPWLGSGFIHAVEESCADEFALALAELGFTVSTMRPGAPNEFHGALAAAMNFPEYYGRNWDAAHDCFSEVSVDDRFALVWRDADETAISDPKLFAEAATVLSRELEALGLRGSQAILVITGSGDAFHCPPDST